jgi:monoamine oxidase
MLPSAESQPQGRVQLQIIIVGAGIAGFAAAIALRRAGHNVKVGSVSGFCVFRSLFTLKLTNNHLHSYLKSHHSRVKLDLPSLLRQMGRKS